MFKTIQQIHFVGIGGAGMSGIAEVLITLGYKVTGSDAKKTEVTERLEKMGAHIFYGHVSGNVGAAQVVVTSTAVKADNPEVVEAHARKVPVIPRIEMLAELARLKYTIAVAGTHGKTTTTSMLASILLEAGTDPTFIIGGKLNHLQSGAKLGGGEFLVAEADESDGSFLKLSPTFAIVTNIDNDHLDYYGSMKKLYSSFAEFTNRVPFYGCSILCADDAGSARILGQVRRRLLTYGTKPGPDFVAENIKASPEGSAFTVVKHETILGELKLKVSGRHNVLNAMAACVCALELSIPFDLIASALAKFENVQRRLEHKGVKNGAVWVDDYGHHPTEIRATLSALREKYPDRRLVVLFQPHRYTRTKLLLKEFADSFSDASEVALLPIYPAGEKPIPGVSSDKLVPLLKKKGVKVVLLKDGKADRLADRIEAGTVLVTLGAGDVWKSGQKLFFGE